MEPDIITPTETPDLANGDIAAIVAAIPDEAWPLIQWLGTATAVATAIWIALSVFIWWRRSASNLTPVMAAEVNRRASPDFLERDEAGRAEAIARGAAYDKSLDARDADAARKRDKADRNARKGRGLARGVSFAMALFTLATMISGTIFQVSYMGRLWEEYSAGERMFLVVQKHPLTFAIGALVILYNIVRFIADRKWQQEA